MKSKFKDEHAFGKIISRGTLAFDLAMIFSHFLIQNWKRIRIFFLSFFSFFSFFFLFFSFFSVLHS